MHKVSWRPKKSLLVSNYNSRASDRAAPSVLNQDFDLIKKPSEDSLDQPTSYTALFQECGGENLVSF